MTRSILITLASLSLSLTSATANARPANGGGALAPILGDIDGDCLVSVSDLSMALAGVRSGNTDADLNGDGEVNGRDVDMVNAVMGTTCADRLSGDVNGDGVVTSRDILAALALVRTNSPLADLNHDGVVNAIDLGVIEASFGATFASRVLGDADGDGVVTTKDILVANAQLGRLGSADCDGDGTVEANDIAMITARLGAGAWDTLTGDINGDRKVDAIDQDLLEANLGTNWNRADVDNNGTVSIDDLLMLLAAISDTTATTLLGDINGDGATNTADYLLVESLFSGDDPVADINGDGWVTVADLMLVMEGIGSIYADNLDGDVDGNCSVGTEDIALIEAAMGSQWMLADIDGNGTVNVSDLISALSDVGNTCE